MRTRYVCHSAKPTTPNQTTVGAKAPRYPSTRNQSMPPSSYSRRTNHVCSLTNTHVGLPFSAIWRPSRKRSTIGNDTSAIPDTTTLGRRYGFLLSVPAACNQPRARFSPNSATTSIGGVKRRRKRSKRRHGWEHRGGENETSTFPLARSGCT